MKTSLYNFVDNDSVITESTSIELLGETSDNLIDKKTLNVYASTGDINASVDNLGNVTADFVALFNVRFDVSITIELYDEFSALLASETFTEYNIADSKYKHILYEIPTGITGIDRIKIYTGAGTATTGDVSYCGYMWLGAWHVLGKLTALQNTSNSADIAQMTRANTPIVQKRYRFRTYDITTAYDTLRSLQTKIEAVIDVRYAKGRPWFFDDKIYLQGDIYFANMASGKYKYDNKETNLKDGVYEFSAQTTFEIREVT